MQKKFLGLAIAIVVVGFATGCAKISRIFGAGGTEFIVRVETEKPNLDEVAELAVRVMGSRLDAAGIDGEAARVPESPDQIRVKVYGDQDLEIVKRSLFTTHELELKKAVSHSFPAPVTTYPTAEAAGAAARAGQEVLPFNERGESSKPSQFVIVEAKPVITGEDIRTAQAVTRGTPDYVISFTLNKDGAEKFGEWTNRNIGNYMAVVLDGSIVSAAYIRSQIVDTGQISGSFTKASAEELASNLNSGYLPAKLIVLDERRFGN